MSESEKSDVVTIKTDKEGELDFLSGIATTIINQSPIKSAVALIVPEEGFPYVAFHGDIVSAGEHVYSTLPAIFARAQQIRKERQNELAGMQGGNVEGEG